MDFEIFWQVFTYIVTVVIGGVIYKFYKLITENKHTTEERQDKNNQQLIENLERRITEVTSRTNQLEEQINDYHKNEVDFISKLAKAETKVEMLDKRVKSLEETKTQLQQINNKYLKKYGPIEDIDD